MSLSHRVIVRVIVKVIVIVIVIVLSLRYDDMTYQYISNHMFVYNILL